MIERNNDIKEFDLHLLDETSEKRFKFLSPHMKQHFLDCIRNRKPLISDEEGHLSKKHYESLFGLSDGHRYLLSKSQHNQTPLSPDSVPSSGSSPKPKSHVAAQAISPTPEHSHDDFSFLFASPPPPPRPHSSTHVDKQRKAIIVAVTASGIIILIGLLLCCREVRKSKKVDKNDRPLLILSATGFSGGMSMFGFLCLPIMIAKHRSLNVFFCIFR
jgi:hypothetical protein